MAKRVVVFAGKLAGASLVFFLAFVPVQIFILVLLKVEFALWARWGLNLINLASLLSLPIWVFMYRKATGNPKTNKGRLLEVLWVVVPLFGGGLFSIPFYLISVLVGGLP